MPWSNGPFGNFATSSMKQDVREILQSFTIILMKIKECEYSYSVVSYYFEENLDINIRRFAKKCHLNNSFNEQGSYLIGIHDQHIRFCFQIHLLDILVVPVTVKSGDFEQASANWNVVFLSC